jgi:hypothetical protein
MIFTHVRARAYFWTIVIVIGVLAVCGLQQGQAARQPEAARDGLGRYAQQATPLPTLTFGPVVGGLAAGGATAAATPPAITPTPLPTLRSDLMGIQVYGNIEQSWWTGIVDRAQFMGFKWIKIQLSWKELEPDAKGKFSPQMDAIKTNVIYAGRRGFKILLSIAKAPNWARLANVQSQRDGPPAKPEDLASSLMSILDQMGLDYVNALEIWNEPNTIAEWTGAPLDGGTYMKYFNAAYQAIRTRSGTIPIITAGPAPAADGAGSTDDRKWLQQIYSAGLPINDPNLFIGVHPYGWTNPPDAQCCVSPSKGWDNNKMFFFLDTIKDYRQIMLQNNHAQGKLWVTEFGWPTFQGLHVKDHIKGPAAMPPADPGLAWMNILTEDQQATYTVRAFQLAQSGELATYVGLMVLWNMNFSSLVGYVDNVKPSLPEAGFSVLDSDWNPRPVYNLIQAAPKK